MKVFRLLKNIKHTITHTFDKLGNKAEFDKASSLTKHTKPIYHIHIRKTAGTTINFAFLKNQTYGSANEFYEALSGKRNHRLIQDGKVFVGWNEKIINEGHFSYAFSHAPLHRLRLPENAFRFTCLRDPVKRVISHYNMLMLYKKSDDINHQVMKREGKWLGSSFEDFMNNIPEHHLLNQLYMFSETYDIEEAVENICGLDYVLFLNDLADGFEELEEITGWDLRLSNQKSYGHKEDISDEEKQQLKSMMGKEYVMLDKVKKRIHQD